MSDYVIPKAALDQLLDYADALAAEVRLIADSVDEAGASGWAAERRTLADRYDMARRAIEDPEDI